MLTICVPCQDSVSSSFANSLAKLASQLTKDGINYHLYFLTGTVLSESRQRLAEDAVKNGSKYILWLDTDMYFTPNIFSLLQKHNKPIVAATYSTRKPPFRSVAFTDEFDYDKRLNEKSGLHSVFAVGMGCMLTETNVFKDLPKPWFPIVWDLESNSYVGEDISFCKLAYNNGYEIFVDVDASKNVAHTGNKLFLLGETDEYNTKI